MISASCSGTSPYKVKKVKAGIHGKESGKDTKVKRQYAGDEPTGLKAKMTIKGVPTKRYLSVPGNRY